jgi:hypothetical protein
MASETLPRKQQWLVRRRQSRAESVCQLLTHDRALKLTRRWTRDQAAAREERIPRATDTLGCRRQARAATHSTRPPTCGDLAVPLRALLSALTAPNLPNLGPRAAFVGLKCARHYIVHLTQNLTRFVSAVCGSYILGSCLR